MSKTSQEAAAELYRLAQATALLRLLRDGITGTIGGATDATTITPTEADFKAVEREHPDLVALAKKAGRDGEDPD
jgi:hypothetical protein